MKKIVILLREYVELPILIIVCAVVIILDILRYMPQEFVNVIILSILALMGVSIARIGIRMIDNSKKLNNIYTIISKPKKVELLEPEKNPNIWEGFQGTYLAWNAPFRLEDELKLSKYTDDHCKRYINKNFDRAMYLFFTGNRKDKIDCEIFEKRFQNFKAFVKRLHNKCGKVIEEKLKIKVIVENFPKLTFFIGQKNQGDYCIIYFHEKPFMSNDFPAWAFVIKENAIITSLKEEFMEKSYLSHSISIDQLLSANNSEELLKKI